MIAKKIFLIEFIIIILDTSDHSCVSINWFTTRFIDTLN